ncbi:protein IRON-RELATED TRANSCRIPTION FACTOR 3-like [Phragmites australis]|uniref:protein IRON-RELATED TRANSCRIPTION FACTOR 3-like n=1 Tax=Phragmites australis TaxID=29695 RepID=UPI002D77E26D|nr:protein IRON-RELATED TRANSCRIPTION FACTOR 3-like [Phragmites australis]
MHLAAATNPGPSSLFPQSLRFRSEGRKVGASMVPSERGSVATVVSTAAAEKLLHGPISGKKCKKKAPRKIHKTEREKLKRDHLNDLFGELGNMLEADRQNNGKACILTDTTRILRHLLSQVESLRMLNSNLQNESHHVAVERNELQDETNVLRKEILELQNESRIRLSSNPDWGHGITGSVLPVPHSTTAVFSSQQPMQPPTIASTVFTLQQPLPQPAVIEQPCATPPLELKLFLEAASVESYEPSENQEAHSHVTRPQARYPTQATFCPASLLSALPRMEDEQCSSSTTGSSKEASTGRG